jgi:hypothetical protein
LPATEAEVSRAASDAELAQKTIELTPKLRNGHYSFTISNAGKGASSFKLSKFKVTSIEFVERVRFEPLAGNYQVKYCVLFLLS